MGRANLSAGNRRLEPDDTTIGPLAVRILSEEEQTELLRALMQSTDYGVLVTDHRGDDLIANRRLGELFDLDPREMVRLEPARVREQTLSRVSDPEAFARRLEAIYEQPDLAAEDEIEVVQPRHRILRRHTAPLTNAAGRNIGRIWTFLDITQTRRLQQEVERAAEALAAEVASRTADLRATTEVLRAMEEIVRAISRAPDIPSLVAEIACQVRHLFGHQCAAVLLCDEDGQTLSGAISSTRRAHPERVLVRRDEDLDIAACLAAEGEEPPVQVFDAAASALLAGRGCRLGSLVPLSIRGRVAGVLLMGADTDPGAESRYLREHVQAVAGLIAIAIETHLLQSELARALRDLRQAQERLVAAEKLSAAATLATSVAHDIRNIITPLNVELGLLSEAPNEAVRAAREQVNRLAVLTQRLLAFARPTQLQQERVPVPLLFDRLRELLAVQTDLERVTLVMEDETDGGAIRADVARLEQLFLNLAFNAFHAMAPAGGVWSIRAVRGPESRLAFRCEDTGRGLAPEHLARLFEPFFTTKASGTGLGLFSCQRIAADHGGELSAENRPEGGACFTLWLPEEP